MLHVFVYVMFFVSRLHVFGCASVWVDLVSRLYGDGCVSFDLVSRVHVFVCVWNFEGFGEQAACIWMCFKL